MTEGLVCEACGMLLSHADFTEDRTIAYRVGDKRKQKEEVFHTERYCANPDCRKDEAIVYEGGKEAEGIFAVS